MVAVLVAPVVTGFEAGSQVTVTVAVLVPPLAAIVVVVSVTPVNV